MQSGVGPASPGGNVFRSPYPDAVVPDASFTEFVLARAGEWGEKPALIDGTGVTSYAELAGSVRRVAAGLAARGFRKGDVFAVYSPNLPEYAVAIHAVATLGGVVTTANPLYTADEFASQLNDAGAKYLLTVPPFLETARQAASRARIEEVFVLGEAEGATPFSALMHDGPVPDVRIEPREDLLFLPYSSGTTGRPKGVMLTHHNVVANVAQTIAHSDVVRETDIVIAVLPFFHIYGLSVVLNASLRIGATVVTMPRFALEGFLKSIQDHRATVVFAVPPIVLALAKHPLVDSYDLSSVRVIFSGAAPLDGDLSLACEQRLGCPPLRQGYGMSEASPVTHISDPALIKPGAIGPVVPNTECVIVDIESGASLGTNEQGEVWVRGPQVMKGYLNRPDATAATVDGNGWLKTGDIGYVDEDGHLTIVDRLKELIKYKGFQVAPAELEAVLLSHPRVSDAAVIGSPDEEAGEVPKAFVVTTGEAASPEEVMTFVAERVAPHKKVRRLEFIEEIPKSPSGKILRRVLVEREKRTAAGAPDSM